MMKSFKMKTMNRKRIYFIAMFFAMSVLGNRAFAQASDAPGLPYHVPTIMEIITEAVEQPTDTNAFVSMLYEAQDFPAIVLGQALDNATLADIQTWVETHVVIMQEFQKERKRNYDKFYLNQVNQ